MKLTPDQYKNSALEKDVRKAIKDFLNLLPGCDYYYNLNAGIGVYKGLSDLVAFYQGKVYFIEIKRPVGGKQSKCQVAFEEMVNRHTNVVYVLARSVDDVIDSMDVEL